MDEDERSSTRGAIDMLLRLQLEVDIVDKAYGSFNNYDKSRIVWLAAIQPPESDNETAAGTTQ